MKTFRSMTVDMLIAELDRMSPEAPLAALSDKATSYRGYYEHVAIEPGEGTTAGSLSAYLKSRLGAPMYGYKGGDYTFDGDCYVFVAGYGETGPALAGFTEDGEPIGFEQGMF